MDPASPASMLTQSPGTGHAECTLDHSRQLGVLLDGFASRVDAALHASRKLALNASFVLGHVCSVQLQQPRQYETEARLMPIVRAQIKHEAENLWGRRRTARMAQQKGRE